MLREVYEQSQTMRETYHFATLKGCDVENPRHPVNAVGRE
jgi:hypothetical protein